MKKICTFGVLGLFLYACSSQSNDKQEKTRSFAEKPTTSTSSDYDPNRGLGKFESIELGEQLDPSLAKTGETVANLKCASCHKDSEERLVGPGWAGVTSKHKPEWIMNFITNPDPMIDQDPELQTQLEICMVRMPNQNLSDEDARAILEFMRQNDGVQ